MADVTKVPRNGLRVVSTFSGCGGSSLGLRMAGFTTVWANEFIPIARDTYIANAPGVPVCPCDIRTVTVEQIRAVIGDADLDLLEGSPPCASFTSAGHRDKGWGEPHPYSEDVVQRTDDLFAEYIRLLGGLRPRAFVAENVAGLTKGKARGWLVEILAALRGCGYVVEARLLDSSWLGVPQKRQRIIIVGIRDDLHREPIFPTPFDRQIAVNEVLPHIKWIKFGGRYDNWKRADRPAATIVASSGGWASFHSYFASLFIRTVDGEVRTYSIPELRVLQSFPADFELLGTFAQQWERVGRSVPPLLMKAVGEKIAEVLRAS